MKISVSRSAYPIRSGLFVHEEVADTGQVEDSADSASDPADDQRLGPSSADAEHDPDATRVHELQTRQVEHVELGPQSLLGDRRAREIELAGEGNDTTAAFEERLGRQVSGLPGHRRAD